MSIGPQKKRAEWTWCSDVHKDGGKSRRSEMDEIKGILKHRKMHQLEAKTGL